MSGSSSPETSSRKRDAESSDSSGNSSDNSEGSSPKRKQAKISEDDNNQSDLKTFYADKRKAVCSSVLEFKFNKKRLRMVSPAKELREGPILYWMCRDQRVEDNWALLQAQKLALKQEVPFFVCFCLPETYLHATSRQYNFMMAGLKEVEKDLHALHIPFYLLLGDAATVLPSFIEEKKIGGLVTDFMPLRLPLEWLEKLKETCPKDLPICQVDAHNIVPCWHASDKQEYGARTIRPKITKQLTDFLTEFPPVADHKFNTNIKLESVDWQKAKEFVKVDDSVQDAEWAVPGTSSGLQKLESFCTQRLKYFSTLRNDPTRPVLSNLSPWFHSGQLSPQRAALRVREFRQKYSDSVAAFLEESIVRRELADNFCFYNLDKYDSVEGAASWAQKTLTDHSNDKREKVYTKEQLENGKTHDDLWNAAQLQMVKEGKMHGFLRMYWAKKILEWTASPEEALEISLYLNDKYELDGMDPNGYVGCMWSICGIHDQGWAERPVFGKIRYMNYKGCQRKFDVKTFVRKYAKK